MVYLFILFSVNIKPPRHCFGFSLAWGWQNHSGLNTDKYSSLSQSVVSADAYHTGLICSLLSDINEATRKQEFIPTLISKNKHDIDHKKSERSLRAAPSDDIFSRGLQRSLRSTQTEDAYNKGSLRYLRSAENDDIHEKEFLRSVRFDKRGLLKSLILSPSDDIYQRGFLRSLRSPVKNSIPEK